MDQGHGRLLVARKQLGGRLLRDDSQARFF
jgi:hypothetical protein